MEHRLAEEAAEAAAPKKPARAVAVADPRVRAGDSRAKACCGNCHSPA